MRTDAYNFLRTNVQKEWIISYFCVRCLKHKKNMNRQEIPVLLLTGYLGSGKTTLVNRILSNEKGIRFAVIVNDIGEVNIDADLIQRGGVVGTQDDSLVALQNGCICCTLKTDLMNQITELIQMRRFDYIVIEASGICEPEPIARTICTMPRMDPRLEDCGIFPRLDCIVTVVDALRLQDEFACGDSLMRENLDEEDIENLIQRPALCPYPRVRLRRDRPEPDTQHPDVQFQPGGCIGRLGTRHRGSSHGRGGGGGPRT